MCACLGATGVGPTGAQLLLTQVNCTALILWPAGCGTAVRNHGRVRVIQATNLVFIRFVAACGAATSFTQLMAFRLILGLTGSMPPCIASSVIGDAFRPDSAGRPQAVALYLVIQSLGPVVGPITSGVVVQYTSWRWLFYGSAIASVAVQIYGLFFTRRDLRTGSCAEE